MSTLSNRLANGFLKKYHGVTGGVLFRGKAAQKFIEQNPKFKSLNNVLWAAPAWKWGLAVVPLYGVLTNAPAEKIDLNNALALAGTGFIWAYYSMLVRPKSYGLFSVSVALVCANGWNAYRRYQYDLEKKAQGSAGKLLPAAVFAVETKKQ